MARLYAAERDGWALAKRGKQAKAVKIRETGDGVPVGTVRALGVPYEPITPAITAFHAFVEKLLWVAKGRNPPVSYVLDWRLNYLSNHGHNSKQARTRFRRLADHFGHIGVYDVTMELCRQYADRRSKEGYANASIHGDLGHLRSALRSAWREKIIDYPAHEHVWNISTPEGRKHVLTPDQFWAWYDAATSAHIRLFLLIALLTAQRHRAILELKWDHVDFERRLIDFTASLKKNKSVTDRGYQKPRGIVKMSDTLYAHLMAAKSVATTAYVIEYQGRPVMSQGGCWRGVTTARKAAELPDWVTPHVLRHTAVSWAADTGVDVEKIASMTGHKDRRVLESVYLHRDKGVHSSDAVDAVDAKIGGRLRIIK